MVPPRTFAALGMKLRHITSASIAELIALSATSAQPFLLAFSVDSVLEIPIHVFEFNAFLSKFGAPIRAKILFYAEKQFFSSTVGHWPNRSKTLQIASKLQNTKELDPIVGTGT